MKKTLKAGLIFTALLLSVSNISATGVAKYQGKEIVTKKDVEGRIKELKLDSMKGDQLYTQILISLAEEKIMAMQIKASKMESDPEFQRVAKLNAEEFKRNYYIQKEAKKRITQQMRQSVYDQMKAATQGKKEIKPRLLVVEDESKVNEVKAALKKGESFESLVKKYSVDPSKDNPNGVGLLDQFIMEEAFSVEDTKKIVDLKEGVVSEPMKTMIQTKMVYTFFLIEKGNRRDFKMPAIDAPEVLGHIEQMLMRQTAGMVQADFARQLDVYDLNGNKVSLVPEQENATGIPLIGGGIKK